MLDPPIDVLGETPTSRLIEKPAGTFDHPRCTSVPVFVHFAPIVRFASRVVGGILRQCRRCPNCLYPATQSVS